MPRQRYSQAGIYDIQFRFSPLTAELPLIQGLWSRFTGKSSYRDYLSLHAYTCDRRPDVLVRVAWPVLLVTTLSCRVKCYVRVKINPVDLVELCLCHVAALASCFSVCMHTRHRSLSILFIISFISSSLPVRRLALFCCLFCLYCTPRSGRAFTSNDCSPAHFGFALLGLGLVHALCSASSPLHR